MDYECGLQVLRKYASGSRWRQDFDLYEARLNENLRDEHRYGSSEQSRRDRAIILGQLNVLAHTLVGISFNDICQGKLPHTMKGTEPYDFSSYPSDELLVDVAIVTVLPEEYDAVLNCLPAVVNAPISEKDPNIYGWVVASITSATVKSDYRVVVCRLGRPGNVQGALGILTTIRRWSPRYVLLVGIAGGFPLDGLQKGDVVFSDIIYGYEYGKLDKVFIPRHTWVYQSDQGLFNCALSIAADTSVWSQQLTKEYNRTIKALPAYIASGDKVVDDPDIEFFSQVRQAWPKLHAVEMEGAGSAAAIEHARTNGLPIGFMMIRGISDMPRPEDLVTNTNNEDSGRNIRGTEERDAWKKEAAKAAAVFAVALISSGLPMPPKSIGLSKNR